MMVCERCGGQVLFNFSDDIQCLQCSCPHDKEGHRIWPKLAMGRPVYDKAAGQYRQEKYRIRVLQKRSRGLVKV